MRIGAEEHRLYWKILAVGFVVDLIGAAFLAIVLQKISGTNEDSFFMSTALIWLGIQIFRFVVMFLDIVRLWAAKELGAFNASRSAFLSALQESDLPKPNGYIPSIDAYLSGVVDDESQAPKARATAGCLFGIRQGTKNLGIWHSVFLDSAHEKALKQYAGS
jgi:hypothetical protein